MNDEFQDGIKLAKEKTETVIAEPCTAMLSFDVLHCATSESSNMRSTAY